jgi:hypothetical protein
MPKLPSYFKYIFVTSSILKYVPYPVVAVPVELILVIPKLSCNNAYPVADKPDAEFISLNPVVALFSIILQLVAQFKVPQVKVPVNVGDALGAYVDDAVVVSKYPAIDDVPVVVIDLDVIPPP